MKPNELMIGDWVLYGNVYSKVWCLDDASDLVGLDLPNNMSTQDAHFEDISPIPLTPEILEKNGFEKSYSSVLTTDGYKKLPVYKYKNMKQAHDICRNLIKVCVSLDGSKYDVKFGIGSYIFDLKYVHQLQHALRLCGIDKEIEL